MDISIDLVLAISTAFEAVHSNTAALDFERVKMT